MIYGIVCGPQIAAMAGLSYSSKAKDADLEEPGIRLSTDKPHEILAWNQRTPRKEPYVKREKKLPRGVHPAGKFRRPKV